MGRWRTWWAPACHCPGNEDLRCAREPLRPEGLHPALTQSASWAGSPGAAPSAPTHGPRFTAGAVSAQGDASLVHKQTVEMGASQRIGDS